MLSDISKTIPLARYLFTRVRQLGCTHIHGVPGDFTLKALDHVQPAGCRWVASCNELNAGYAADGYGRIRGLGALMTTYGVGELSAINAVAGSYAEGVPVVHIVGTPQNDLQERGALVHHLLGTMREERFRKIAKLVTASQAKLDKVDEAPGEIDRILGVAVANSLPVYVELPCDMVNKEVNAESLKEPIVISTDVQADDERNSLLAEELAHRINQARQPLLLVDSGSGCRGMRAEINTFVKASKMPALAMPSGNGMVDHQLPNYYGVHSGPVGRIDTMNYVDSCDLVIAFGPMFSDTQTLGWKTVPDEKKTTRLGKNFIHFPERDPESINLGRFLERLVSKVNISNLANSDVSLLGDFRTIEPAAAGPHDHIEQTNLYLRLSPYIQQNDIVLLGNATPILGGRDLILPPGGRMIASGQWFSIGHMLPAAQGAALAQSAMRERGQGGRTILLDGDGSFQVTAQELSTIIRERLDVTIFIINNGGYAYERQIHGMNEDYNDLAPWRYVEAARFLGADRYRPDYLVETFELTTWDDLDKFMEESRRQFELGPVKGLKIVDVKVGKFDVPEKFKQVFAAANKNLG